MPIRIAIAGLGPRGRDWIRAVQATPSFDLVACTEEDDTLTQAAIKECGLSPGTCYSSIDSTLDQCRPDAFIVATALDSHRSVAESALLRGVPTIVEKPFASSLRDAIELVSLAERSGVPLLVGQYFRYLAALRTARTLVRDQVLGRVGLAVVQPYRVPREMSPWLARHPHTALMGMAVHHFDALRYILGQEATAVSADNFTLPWGAPVGGANLRASLTFDGGTHATYVASYQSAGHEYFDRGQEFYCRFIGERATLHILQRWVFLCERNRLPRMIRRHRRAETEEQQLLRQLERAIQFGEEPEVSGRDNLQTMATIEACIRSSASQKWVNPQTILRPHLAPASAAHNRA